MRDEELLDLGHSETKPEVPDSERVVFVCADCKHEGFVEDFVGKIGIRCPKCKSENILIK